MSKRSRRGRCRSSSRRGCVHVVVGGHAGARLVHRGQDRDHDHDRAARCCGTRSPRAPPSPAEPPRHRLPGLPARTWPGRDPRGAPAPPAPRHMGARPRLVFLNIFFYCLYNKNNNHFSLCFYTTACPPENTPWQANWNFGDIFPEMAAEGLASCYSVSCFVMLDVYAENAAICGRGQSVSNWDKTRFSDIKWD